MESYKRWVCIDIHIHTVFIQIEIDGSIHMCTQNLLSRMNNCTFFIDQFKERGIYVTLMILIYNLYENPIVKNES